MVLSKLRSINIKKAGICSVSVGIVNVLIHILVLAQLIPYEWVNGGRTTSYSMAKDVASSSIIMTLINIAIALVASKMIPVRFNKFWGIALSVFLIVTLPFGLLGVIQQFLGTDFERYVMSIVTIIGFCADVRIAVEKRW